MIQDFNRYNKIHHIGDLHGCLYHTKQFLKKGIVDDELYIFTGNYLDAGGQNGYIARWLLDNVTNNSNILLLFGDRDIQIKKYSNNIKPNSANPAHKEFVSTIAPQLQDYGFTTNDARKLTDRMIYSVIYDFDKTRYVVTHAGVQDYYKAIPPIDPRETDKYNRRMMFGDGNYNDCVDAAFSMYHRKENIIQIHGYRNPHDLPTHAAAKSYNLRGKEYNRCSSTLRIVTVERGEKRGASKITPIEIQHFNYDD